MRISKELKDGKWTGRWKVDYQDAKRGISRTRQMFDTKKEAEAYAAKLKEQGAAFLLGQRQRRTFGEALVKYLLEVAPQKKSFETEAAHHIVPLRWPFLHDGRFVRLEDIYLESPPNQLDIAMAMESWRADMRAVLRRSRIDGEHYHYRRTPKGEFWFHQPRAISEDQPPPIRRQVTNPELLARLESAKGAGPYKPDTLRNRQAIVKAVLTCAWKWRWTEHNTGSRIEAEKPGAARDKWLTQTQRFRLLLAAAKSEHGIHLAHAIWAATIIGWRRSNLFGVTWDNVVWPTRNLRGEAKQPGFITVAPEASKTGKPLIAPMTPALERLLRRRQAIAKGPLVFHRGNGEPFGSFPKTWKTICRAAQLPDDFRWHDLRHAWASFTIQSGGSIHDLQILGGWNSQAMPKRYTHLAVEHLLDSAAKAANPRKGK